MTLRPGSWFVRCPSDPRWNGSGSGMVGNFEMPADTAAHIEVKKKELGIEPPKDLEYEYMKD